MIEFHGRQITEEEAEAYIRTVNLMKTTNAAFFPLYRCEKKYLVLKGGGGSGKSEFAGRKLLERMQVERGHRFLVVRKVGETLRGSCFDSLKRQIDAHYDPAEWTFTVSPLQIKHANGNVILFEGLDDVEKLKSIDNVTGIWIEEASEIELSDFNQLDIRLRGKTDTYLQMIISFNPIDRNHWLKKRFFDYKDPDAEVHESTYHDNRFLPDVQRRVLEGFKEKDQYFYNVYCLGNWGVYGHTVFDASKLADRRDALEGQKCNRGIFDTNGEWLFAAEAGSITIYEEPQNGHPYVIGGDTAGEGSDYFTAQVLDNSNKRQVATLRMQYADDDEYAEQVYWLSRYYNNALIAVEVNFSAYPVKCLTERRAHQYVRQREDTYTGKMETAFGFRTTTKTRPVAIAKLVEYARDRTECLHDIDTIEEMLGFVRNEKGRMEASPGGHDDLVMALAIALYCADQQSTKITITRADKEKKVQWTKDMLEDYYKSAKDPELRARILERWGNPVFGSRRRSG